MKRFYLFLFSFSFLLVSQLQAQQALTQEQLRVRQELRQKYQDFLKKAEHGDPSSQNEVGTFLYYGLAGLRANPVEAATWFKKAADQGNTVAQRNYGLLLSTGQGVLQNYKKAVLYLQKAAVKGDLEAKKHIAGFYFYGQGLPEDKEKAAGLYKETALGGLADSQKNYGLVLYKGQGADQDYYEAYIWLSIASANGYTDVRQFRDDAASRLTKEQIEKAQLEAEKRLEKIRATIKTRTDKKKADKK